MTSWLDPVRAALASRTTVLEMFVRDDDAGWDDEALFALIDTCADAELAVDVAVIPNALNDALVEKLVEAIGGGAARVHQHGWSHTNHQVEGRKCEFGSARSRAEQFEDIRLGHEVMSSAFASMLDSIFTPPWNRCTAATAEVLVELGIDVLSRDVSAEPFERADLVEVPVTFDWMSKRTGEWSPSVLAERLAAAVATEADVLGLMLHHAVTDEPERQLVREFFDVVAPFVRSVPIIERARLASTR